MVILDVASNLQSILILVGAFAGNFVATMIPYWKVQSQFKELGLGIVFDAKFLGTAAVSALSSFVIVSGAFSTIFVEIDPSSTIIVTFLTAAAIGYGLNSGLNALMPAPNREQREQIAQIEEKAIIDNYEKEKKLQSVLEAETATTEQGSKA